jgi:hypothetical protein
MAKKLAIRPWLRAIHRDAGYVAVGLTLVYALSGLAVNHISDWDPNFTSHETVTELGGPLEGDDDEALAKVVVGKLGVTTPIRDVERSSNGRLDIVLDKRTIHVDTKTGQVVDEGQKPRLLLRAANWLHLNRGKKSWTYIADAYAAALLFLAISGMFMIPGRKGLIGRGAVLVALGVAVPVAYVGLSGGPNAAQTGPKKAPDGKLFACGGLSFACGGLSFACGGRDDLT